MQGVCALRAMAHTASTVQRLLEDGSIKASSVAPNEMYQCHYLAHGTCFCKSPFVPGAGSSGGNRDWNSYIVAGQTPPSGLTKSGMERANLEVNSAFMLYGLTFAGVVYAGNKIIGATSATLEPAYPSVSQMGGFLNVFDWNCGVGKPFDQFISISRGRARPEPVVSWLASSVAFTCGATLSSSFESGAAPAHHWLPAKSMPDSGVYFKLSSPPVTRAMPGGSGTVPSARSRTSPWSIRTGPIMHSLHSAEVAQAEPPLTSPTRDRLRVAAVQARHWAPTAARPASQSTVGFRTGPPGQCSAPR